jgi:hypothetical protein
VAKLTAAQRNKIPASKFALPGGRYPVEDKSHARNAKARASQQLNAGRLSPSEKATIDRRADQVLGEPRGHDPKEKSTVKKEETKHKGRSKTMAHKGKAHHEAEAARHERLMKHHKGMAKKHHAMAAGKLEGGGKDPAAGRDGENDKFSKGTGLAKAPLRHGAAAASPSAEWGAGKVAGRAGTEGIERMRRGR